MNSQNSNPLPSSAVFSPPFTRRFLPALGSILFLANGMTAFGNLVINPVWDSSITSDPNAATIMSTINSAIAIYQARFADPVTVSIKFQETGSGLGGSSTFFGNISYSSYRSALVTDATTSSDSTALAHLPNVANNPVNGNANISVTTANLRALGFAVSPPSGQADSTISLNTSIMNLNRLSIDPGKYDLMAVVSHEIDEALGFGSALNGLGNGSAPPTGAVWGMDLYRYDQLGVRSFNTTAANQAYFSLDGTTQLSRFNQTAGGDYSDWFSITAHTPQVQDAFGTPGAIPNLGVELTGLDVLGYNLLSVPEPTTFSLFALTFGATWFYRKTARKF
jgi:hypothetical protein